MATLVPHFRENASIVPPLRLLMNAECWLNTYIPSQVFAIHFFFKSRIGIGSLQIPLRSVELLVPFSFINIQTYVDNYIYDI